VDEYNIEKLEDYLRLARSLKEGGDISQLQVDQFEQQVLLRRTNLLTDQLQYLQALDQFKLQLDLPTALPIELDDSAFRPLNQMFERYENLFRLYEAAIQEAERLGTLELAPTVRRELRGILTSSAILRGTRFRTEIETRWGAWEKLSADELQKRLDSSKAEYDRLKDKEAELKGKNQDLSMADQQRLITLENELHLGTLEKVLRDYESQPWKNVPDPGVKRRQQEGKYQHRTAVGPHGRTESLPGEPHQLSTGPADLVAGGRPGGV
jgi:hypothetical protein